MGASFDGHSFRPPRAWRRALRCAGTDLDNQLDAGGPLVDELQNTLYMVLLEPVDDKAVGGKQSQYAAIINGLQGTNPGIELLLGKLCLQHAKALVP